ncbi:MAG: hypothetical protein AAB262_07425 [Elusimicrobiota bacterium]
MPTKSAQTMTTAAGLLFILVCVLPLRAAAVSWQTLDTLRGEVLRDALAPACLGTPESAASRSGNFFDASVQEIKESAPVAFARLRAPLTKDVRLSDNVPTLDINVPAPKNPAEAGRDVPGSSGAGTPAAALGIVSALLTAAALTVFLASRRPDRFPRNGASWA